MDAEQLERAGRRGDEPLLERGGRRELVPDRGVHAQQARGGPSRWKEKPHAWSDEKRRRKTRNGGEMVAGRTPVDVAARTRSLSFVSRPPFGSRRRLRGGTTPRGRTPAVVAAPAQAWRSAVPGGEPSPVDRRRRPNRRPACASGAVDRAIHRPARTCRAPCPRSESFRAQAA